MARYIRTDELLATARDGYHSDFGRSMADLTSLREVIEDTPTADVVEVVRCKDCKYWELRGIDKLTEHEFGECKCPYWSNDVFCYETNDNDFCSNAKRKDYKND